MLGKLNIWLKNMVTEVKYYICDKYFEDFDHPHFAREHEKECKGDEVCDVEKIK